MVGLNVESVTAVGDDWVLDVEVTTNRPDCLSHYGVAREVATLYRKPLKRLEFSSRNPAREPPTKSPSRSPIRTFARVIAGGWFRTCA